MKTSFDAGFRFTPMPVGVSFMHRDSGNGTKVHVFSGAVIGSGPMPPVPVDEVADAFEEVPPPEPPEPPVSLQPRAVAVTAAVKRARRRRKIEEVMPTR
jgi:hypothetical protein